LDNYVKSKRRLNKKIVLCIEKQSLAYLCLFVFIFLLAFDGLAVTVALLSLFSQSSLRSN